METQKLHNLIDKVIGTKGSLRTPAYWMRRVLNAIMEAITAADNEVRELLYALSDKTDNSVNSLSERIKELEVAMLREKYLCFVALEDGLRVGFTLTCEYSLDGKEWTVLQGSNDDKTPEIKKGERIWFRNTNYINGHSVGSFSASPRYSIEGNIMSMLYGDDSIRNLPMKPYAFRTLFSNQAFLIDASQLNLPATKLAPYCYAYMFYASGLINGPKELPATTLADYCYDYMFCNCRELTKAPELPAMNLAQGCYFGMFAYTYFKVAPELPATTLAVDCYREMFYCNYYLETAPVLPALTLTDMCYAYMFFSCEKVSYVKAMFTSEPEGATNSWLSGVSKTGTFVKNAAATWDVTGPHGVPEGWTVETVEVVDNA